MLNFVSRKVAILSIYSYTYLTRKKYNITDIIEIDYGFTEKKNCNIYLQILDYYS